MVQLLQREQLMAVWTQGEQQETELLQRKQYEVQLLQGEQPMPVWTQGEQQKTKLLQRRQYEVQLPQEQVDVEGTCPLPNLDHPPGSSSSTEIPAHVNTGTATVDMFRLGSIEVQIQRICYYYYSNFLLDLRNYVHTYL